MIFNGQKCPSETIIGVKRVRVMLAKALEHGDFVKDGKPPFFYSLLLFVPRTKNPVLGCALAFSVFVVRREELGFC